MRTELTAAASMAHELITQHADVFKGRTQVTYSRGSGSIPEHLVVRTADRTAVKLMFALFTPEQLDEVTPRVESHGSTSTLLVGTAWGHVRNRVPIHRRGLYTMPDTVPGENPFTSSDPVWKLVRNQLPKTQAAFIELHGREWKGNAKALWAASLKAV